MVGIGGSCIGSEAAETGCFAGVIDAAEQQGRAVYVIHRRAKINANSLKWRVARASVAVNVL